MHSAPSSEFTTILWPNFIIDLKKDDVSIFERTSAQKAEVAGYRLEVNPDGEPLTPLRELVNQMPVG